MSREERIEMLKKEFSEVNTYNRPTYCSECGGVMVFQGLGEYKCEKCGSVDYDDYGKARNYVEKHMGANAAEVGRATGVSQRSIRDMLKEGKLEVAKNSVIFLKCEICGTLINSGRYCSKCEAAYHRDKEEMARKARHHGDTFGFSTERRKGEEGAKRFSRDE
ncbi:MAG: hypothetical protein OSJ72_02915 [Lachnospiraceae bacterium]|nr:hypothetical protein [Lachnospiraceae bacterium]